MGLIPHFGLSRQYTKLKDELIDATDRVLYSGNLVSGQYTTEFEDWLSNKTDTKFAITCHSGTQALEIIARYTKRLVEVHDVVTPTIRLPNLTYPATLNAFITAGWNVELMDTDRNGLMITKYLSSKLFTGVYDCSVGLYGANPPGNGTWVSNSTIVDGAQHWLVANYTGIGMAISFDPTKNLPSSGNGGAIVTDSYDLANYARNYRSNGMLTGNTHVGTNSKMSEQDCAHLLVRAHYIDDWQTRREQIKNYWCDLFKELPVRCLSAGITRHANQKFVVYTTDRTALQSHLGEHQIETKINYPYALSELPITSAFKKPDMLSTSVMLTRGVLSLPIYPELSDPEVEHIAKTVIKFYDK